MFAGFECLPDLKSQNSGCDGGTGGAKSKVVYVKIMANVRAF